MLVLNDSDVDRLLPMADAVKVVEAGFLAKSEGHLVAPPRHFVDFSHGSLGFTIGGQDSERGKVGFRVYALFEAGARGETQATLVFDRQTGELEGAVIGDRLGVVRTGAIGGVALKYLANRVADRIGIFGSGPQAWAQVEAAMTQLPIRQLRVFSPTPDHRNEFAQRASSTFCIDARPADSARTVVEDSDVLLCSTTSASPVFESAWLRPGVHVTSMGRKTKVKHEIEPELAQRAEVLVTDSPAQLRAYPEPHLLEGTPSWDRISDLAEIVAGKAPGRTRPDQVSLFLSTGLAGTEVLIAAEILRRSK